MYFTCHVTFPSLVEVMYGNTPSCRLYTSYSENVRERDLALQCSRKLCLEKAVSRLPGSLPVVGSFRWKLDKAIASARSQQLKAAMQKRNHVCLEQQEERAAMNAKAKAKAARRQKQQKAMFSSCPIGISRLWFEHWRNRFFVSSVVASDNFFELLSANAFHEC